MIVYRLYHIRTYPDGETNEKLIGIYTSEQKAKEAVQRVGDKPGFRDFPDGFEIFDLELDTDSWTEGFIVE